MDVIDTSHVCPKASRFAGALIVVAACTLGCGAADAPSTSTLATGTTTTQPPIVVPAATGTQAIGTQPITPPALVAGSGAVPVAMPVQTGAAGSGATTTPPVAVTPPNAPDNVGVAATAGAGAAMPVAGPMTSPPATGDATAPATDVVNWPSDCETHYKLIIYSGSPGTQYQVGAGQELHPQVMFTPPWKGDVQAVAFHPITDNHRVLHHWILYSADGAFLTGWAPGADGTKDPLPDDVGMYLPATGQMRMDVHYNNVTGTTSQMDASGVEVCVIETPSKFRKHTASVSGIVGNATAPAHMHVDNVSTCTVQASMGEATIVYNSPHMHQLGVHAKLELNQGGTMSILHDAEFTFDDQRAYKLDPPVVVKTGDQLTVTCSYTNDTNKNVTFGQNTEDEMCFNFITVYPKGGFSCRGGGGFGLPGF